MGIILRLAALAFVGYTVGSLSQSVISAINKRRIYKNSNNVSYVELTTQDGTIITLNQQQWKELLSTRAFSQIYKTFIVDEPQEPSVIQ